MSYKFDVTRFFPRRLMDAITDARVQRPEVLDLSASRRKRRVRPTRNGKLLMLACDHPGRGVTGALDKPVVMGDRQQYMGRALRALMTPGFDGVMAHSDLIEDMLILDYLITEAGGPSFLDGRLVVGCMNRGGVHNVVGEIHDRFTSFSADSLARLRLDGGKLLIRSIDDDERTLHTVAESANAVTELARKDLLAFVEPLPMAGKLGAYTANYTIANLVKWAGVSAALGETSRNTWLKLPCVSDMETVARATTLPILLLGGPAQHDPSPVLREFAAGMKAGNNIRGAMVGRNILFPGDEDPSVLASAVDAVVHRGADADESIRRAGEARDAELDALSRHF